MMFLKIAFLFLISGYSLGKQLSENCGKSLVPVGRIINGDFAIPGKYPWMVSLFKRDLFNRRRHVCGGSILNKDWILTAAHCVDMKKSDPKDYEIYAGIHSVDVINGTFVQNIQIDKVIPYELPSVPYVNVSRESCKHDIALIKTASPINIEGSRGRVNSICLPSNIRKVLSGDAVTIGWGLTHDGNSRPNYLREVSLPLLPEDDCKEIYNDTAMQKCFAPTTLCAGGNKRGPCHADSGGPLFTYKNNVATLIGIVSKRTRSCSEHPGIYTKITPAFKRWIANQISGDLP